MSARRRSTVGVVALALTGLAALTLAAAAAGAPAAPGAVGPVPAGTVVAGTAPSAAVGAVDYRVYLPAGYDTGTAEYPTLYLLHGRGDTAAAWTTVAGDLDELIAAGTVPPMVVVMPDAPWSNRGSWYVDSLYTGTDPAAGGPGAAVETALTADLVAYVDATYRTVDDRAARAVGGYSMGGAGALRYVLAHQDVFSAAIVLSAAVYTPAPPADSSTRDYGGYGVGGDLFVQTRYDELSYPAGLAAADPALPVHLFIAVGDDEYANPLPEDARHDLDLESATLYNAARRVPGVTAELRVLDGGHDWDVWRPGFRAAVTDLAGYLRTTPVTPLTGALYGTDGDDRAGGVVAHADGRVSLVVDVAGTFGGTPTAGGTDAVVLRRAVDGSTTWEHRVATPAADRLYGLVEGADGSVLAGGYTRGDLDGSHPSGASDDAVVLAVDSSGQRLWTRQAGDPAKADRVYAVSSDGAGGAYVTGYTSGSFEGGAPGGDKDAFVARYSATGDLLWSDQLGGAGEDKGLAVALAADGGVYVGGVAGAALPGSTSLGGYDGWLARYTVDGSRAWVRQVGTSAFDQVLGLDTVPGGVVAVGSTEGVLGASASGGEDAVVLSLSGTGDLLWATQLGTAGADRAVQVVADDDEGALLVAGHTSGRLADGVGGVDLFTQRLIPDGSLGEVAQLGTVERDGTDDWDSNLYLADDGAGQAWMSALSYGSLVDVPSAGAGDVLLTSVPGLAVADDGGAGSGGGAGGTGGTGAVSDPGADAGSALPGSPSTSDGGRNSLARTGAEVLSLLCLGAGALAVGFGARRWATGGVPTR
ncbi:alpha/beta hydrolase-fold protein [Cellulomonas hominis]